MCTLDGTAPNPQQDVYGRAIITHHRHLEAIVLSLCSASECSFLSPQCPVHRGKRERTCEPPLLVVQVPEAPSPPPPSSHSLAHEEGTADGCPGVKRGCFFFLFFFFKSNVCLKSVPLTIYY